MPCQCPERGNVMSTMTIGEAMDRAKDFERRLEALYAHLRDNASRDGVRLLTYYLVRHRRHLPEALKSFSQEQIGHIWKIPLKYEDTEFAPKKCFESRDISEAVTGEEFLTIAIELVENLIGFYRWMVQQPVGHEAESLFQSLLKIEEAHVVELKKMKAMNYF